MNDDELIQHFHKLKDSVQEPVSVDKVLEDKLMYESNTPERFPARRNTWRHLAIAMIVLVCVGFVGVAVADNIMITHHVVGEDGVATEELESAWDFLIRHVHAHLREFHRHMHHD